MAGAEEEEDYMGDLSLFLPPEASQSSSKKQEIQSWKLAGAEPVAVDIRRGRAGIGKEDPEVEKMRREKENAERMKKKELELMEDFGSRQKERWKARRIIINFKKVEAVLAQLENRDILEVEKKEEEDEEEEEEEEITEEVYLLDIFCRHALSALPWF